MAETKVEKPATSSHKKVLLKTVEVLGIQEEVSIHLFFTKNDGFGQTNQWLWIKELEEKIIKKSSGFIRKYVYIVHLIFTYLFLSFFHLINTHDGYCLLAN